MSLKISAKTLVLALTLSLGAAATAFAVAADGERCGFGHGKGHEMRHGMQGMARLHGDLKLDAKQEALWQEAEKAGKESMGGMRDRLAKQREAALTTLRQPGADLRAVLKQMDQSREEGRKLHEANRDRWLAVYDALNPEQKEKARLFFLSKLEHGKRMPGSGEGRTRRE